MSEKISAPDGSTNTLEDSSTDTDDSGDSSSSSTSASTSSQSEPQRQQRTRQPGPMDSGGAEQIEGPSGQTRSAHEDSDTDRGGGGSSGSESSGSGSAQPSGADRLRESGPSGTPDTEPDGQDPVDSGGFRESGPSGTPDTDSQRTTNKDPGDSGDGDASSTNGSDGGADTNPPPGDPGSIEGTGGQTVSPADKSDTQTPVEESSQNETPSTDAQEEIPDDVAQKARGRLILNNPDSFDTGSGGTTGPFDRDDIVVERDSDGNIIARLSDDSVDRASRNRSATFNRTLAGLGVEFSAGGDIRGPDSPDRDTMAQQEAEAERNQVLEGLGFELAGDGSMRAPDSPDRDTLAEQEAQADANRALEGLGMEVSADGTMRGPNAPDNASLAEEQAARDARADIAAQVSEQRGQEYTAEDVTVRRTEDGEIEFDVDTRESFDFDWSLGTGGPEDQVEQAVDDSAQWYTDKATGAADWLFDDGGLLSQPAGGGVFRAAGQDDLGDWYDEGMRDAGRGIVIGGAQLGNIPGLVSVGMEGAETVGAGVSATARGEGSEFREKATRRGSAIGSAILQEAKENKAQTTGMVAGSLIASYGVMAGAARVSSRAGTAARWSIQPGQELAGTAGYRATKATINERTAKRAFPNKEPLIFSEESVIRISRAGGRKARSGGAKTASRVATESKALQFRVAERMRTDAPTRGTRDGFVSRASGRVQQEAVSARFRAAEASSNARQRASNVRDRVTDFAGDDRAQMQAPRSRLRKEQESNFETDQITASELEPSTRSSTVRSRARNDPMSPVQEPSISRRGATKSEINTGSSVEPVPRTRLRLADSTTQDPVQMPMSRLRQAQEASVDTRSKSTRAKMKLESPLEDTLPRSRGRTDSRLKSKLKSDMRTDTKLDTKLDTRLGVKSKQKLDTRQKVKTELKLDLGTKSRIDTKGLNLREDRGGGSDLLGSKDPFDSRLERDLINPFLGE